MAGVASVMTVGPTKNPFLYLEGTDTPRPSRSTRAPDFLADSMSRCVRSTAAREIRGPMSASASRPPLTLSLDAFATTSLTHSLASPTKTATERAMHRWPAAPKAAPTRAFVAPSRLASGRNTPWLRAAMLLCTRLPFCEPRWKMCVPATEEPTNEIDLMSGASQIKLTASTPPWMTEMRPLGNPACSASSTRRTAVFGVRSDGLSTRALPHTVAMGIDHSGIIAGKLNGAIAAVTPSGSRYETMSMFVAMPDIERPSRCVMALLANSTTSRPRWTSPIASARHLPCSVVTSRASSLWFLRMRFAYSAITRTRACTGTCAHDFCAALLDATAASISPCVLSGTRFTISPVAGL
eukprot:Amastigsp_a339752_75.p3 type:complete len:353 gc:universal Amastigsp_a339752_75:1234-176(-)